MASMTAMNSGGPVSPESGGAEVAMSRDVRHVALGAIFYDATPPQFARRWVEQITVDKLPFEQAAMSKQISTPSLP